MERDLDAGANIDEDNGEKDGNGIAGSHEIDEVDGKTPRVGMAFKSYVEVCNFYKQYACSMGFGASVKNSWFTEDGRCRGLVVKCCKGGKSEKGTTSKPRMRTDCKAMIKVNLRDDGLLHVSKVDLEHNHELTSSNVYFFRCNKILPVAVKKRLLLSDEAQLDRSLDGHVAGIGGSGKLTFGENSGNHIGEMKRLKLGVGDHEAIHQFFTNMQSKNPNFFYLMDLSEEGCLRNVFWADAKSRAAYEYFGDVIYFDTTCLTNQYDMPFVSFLGVNHHGQSILLGCGLLSDKSTETYIWLFEAWLACMSRRHPNAIITDQCSNIQAAVSHVFPQSRHRLCLWQIMKTIPEEVGSLTKFKEIEQALKKAVHESLRENEFEEQWREIIEKYRLEENHWFNTLYANRHLWVPFFLKDTFWAGMPITQHGKDMEFFFEGYIHLTTSLKQFFSKYETALQSKYEIEGKADFESFHKKRPLVSKFYMEEKLSKFYTLDIFKKFQDEMQGVLYCNVSLVMVNEPISTFDVKQCVFAEDGKTVMGYKDCEVSYNVNQHEVECVCQYFHFQGFLCRHALAVLCSQQVFDIPSRYILDRWRRDFKQFKALTHSPSNVVVNNEMERYDYLTKQCLQVVELGSMSDTKFQLAIKLVGEMEKLLRTCEDRLVRDEVNAMADENVKNIMPSKTKANGKDLDSVQSTWKGRPPHKRKECDTEKAIKPRKKMIYQIASVDKSESEVVPIASPVPHFDTDIRTQGSINLADLPREMAFQGPCNV